MTNMQLINFVQSKAKGLGDTKYERMPSTILLLVQLLLWQSVVTTVWVSAPTTAGHQKIVRDLARAALLTDGDLHDTGALIDSAESLVNMSRHVINLSLYTRPHLPFRPVQTSLRLATPSMGGCLVPFYSSFRLVRCFIVVFDISQLRYWSCQAQGVCLKWHQFIVVIPLTLELYGDVALNPGHGQNVQIKQLQYGQ